MHTTIKVILASLGLMALNGAAAADDQMFQGQSRALHRAIAMQGDQALLEIRASVVSSIAPSIDLQMASSMQQLAKVDKPSQTQIVDGVPDLTAMAVGH